jgi:hypothetical protein
MVIPDGGSGCATRSQAAMGTRWFRPGERRKRKDYNDAYRARPQDDAVVVAARLARAAYMRAPPTDRGGGDRRARAEGGEHERTGRGRNDPRKPRLRPTVSWATVSPAWSVKT